MSGSAWLLVGFHALLTVIAGCMVGSALKLLQRIEVYISPAGASRVGFVRKLGESFPWELLPKELRGELVRGTVLFLFFSENCSVCMRLLPCLPGLVRSYRHVCFVICSRTGIKTLRVANIRVITNNDLFRTLGIGMVPYALKVEQQRIAEFGIVNSCEHLESVLDASRNEGEE